MRKLLPGVAALLWLWLPRLPAAPDFGPSPLAGTWKFDATRSTELSPWKDFDLTIAFQGAIVTIERRLAWGRRDFTDKVTLDTTRPETVTPIDWWADNRHLGAYIGTDHTRRIHPAWLDGGRILRLSTDLVLDAQQGPRAVNVLSDFKVSASGAQLTLTELRSTRSRPVVYVFTRADRRLRPQAMIRALFSLAASLGLAAALAAQPAPRQVDRAPATATLIPLSENWRMDGDVPVHALLISLQGLANRDTPRVYLEYPKTWQWEIVHPLIGFLEKRHGVKFDRLGLDAADAALARFARYTKGCVVWDKNVRSSLIVAFTIAGLEDAVVVSEDLLPLAAKHGLKPVADLRGQFTGQPDHVIYQWAYDRYYARCSRDYYVVMGGHAGPEMQPGVADFGIQQRAFFSDLSANPRHPEELALLKRILGGQHPASVVLGWHSYGKDTEGQHTTLVGNFGLKMEGLHNLPNVSFTSQIPLTPDFRFANNHRVRRDETLTAGKKIYVAAIATDSMGIGAWTKPGRGKIPYGWQVLMNWSWMNPPALQFFYEDKTPNDYFIGGLSGPGYMYPKSIPADKFPALMKSAREMMARLDLRALEIMDYSEGNRHVGNTDLPKEVVDRYYEQFPDVIGFINGYGSARTFDLRDTRPLISYDYYLDVARPVDEAAADLEELIQLNPARPYFLLMHIRESNTIEKVSQILGSLSEPVEVVPLDIFLKLAASAKTYRTRYQQPTDPIDRNP